MKDGGRRRSSKFITVQGTKRDAERKLRQLMGTVDEHRFVEPDKQTFCEWFDEWLETAVQDKKKLRPLETYKSVLDRHLIPALGALTLQKLAAIHIERYFAGKLAGTLPDSDGKLRKLSPGTLQQHGTIIHLALASAERKKLVHRNEAKLVDGTPRRGQETSRKACNQIAGS